MVIAGVKKFVAMITVEPCAALFMIGVNLTTLGNLHLLLDKACRVNLDEGDALCDALIVQNIYNETVAEAEARVQIYVAQMSSIGKFVQTTIPFVTILLWGLWSDRNHRRKPLILLPMIGELVKNLALIGCVLDTGANAETAFIIENAFPLVFGSWAMVLLGVYSHVMDTTTHEQRTTKVAFSSVFATIGDPLGSALSGIILREFGYNAVFGSSAILMLIGVIYGWRRVEERGNLAKAPVSRHCGTQEEISEEITEQSQLNQIKSGFKLVLDYFNIKGFLEILKVIYRKRANKNRMMLWIGYSIIICGFGPNLGHYSVQYLFSRMAFNFTEVDYSIFGTIMSVTGSIGVITIVWFNTKYFHLSDYGLCMVGIASGIISSVTYGLSRVPRDFYLGAVLDCGFGSFNVAMRSAMMKLVDPEETAKSNAILGALESSLFFLYGSFYSLIYSLTIEIYAGLYYFITTSFYCYTLLAIIFLFFLQKKVQRQHQRQLTKSTLTIESCLDRMD